MKKMKPFSYDREDTCPGCRTERAIEAYDHNNNQLKLSLSIDNNVPIKNVSYLKCKKCKKEFFPNWITDYPTPMTDQSFELFMGGYVTAYKQSETD